MVQVAQIGATLSAALAGGLLGSWYVQRSRDKALRQARTRRMRAGAQMGRTSEGYLADVLSEERFTFGVSGSLASDLPGQSMANGERFRALNYCEELSRGLLLDAKAPMLRGVNIRFAARWFETHVPKAGGFAANITFQGFTEASLRLALGGALLGALVGAVFSNELMAFAALAGFLFGATSVARDIKAAISLRQAQLAKSLPEMLEVLALGLRSGLSFDRSMALYVQHFSSALSFECARALQKWTTGLDARDVALRAVATTYDSALLTRVVEGIVRSLRFGSSMTELLEQAACEARADHRALVEERVAKAPVKMMIPTGTLILPAMLVLVLGPVLLELMGGS